MGPGTSSVLRVFKRHYLPAAQRVSKENLKCYNEHEKEKQRSRLTLQRIQGPSLILRLNAIRQPNSVHGHDVPEETYSGRQFTPPLCSEACSYLSDSILYLSLSVLQELQQVRSKNKAQRYLRLCNRRLEKK